MFRFEHDNWQVIRNAMIGLQCYLQYLCDTGKKALKIGIRYHSSGPNLQLLGYWLAISLNAEKCIFVFLLSNTINKRPKRMYAPAFLDPISLAPLFPTGKGWLFLEGFFLKLAYSRIVL